MKVLRDFVESTVGTLEEASVLTYYKAAGLEADCLSIVVQRDGYWLASELYALLEDTQWAEEIDLLDYLLTHKPSVDSIGNSTIYYWPGLQVIED